MSITPPRTFTNQDAARAATPTASSTPLPAQAGIPQAIRIKARPLVSPDFNNIKAKNPMITLRWVNRTYENGYRVDYHEAQGFEIARPDEVVMMDGRPIPTSLVKDGKIQYGDLICMKLSRELYEGDLLYDHNRAVQRVQRFGSIEQTDGEGNPVQVEDVVRTTVAQAGASRAQLSKIGAFIPTQQQVQQIIGSDPGKQPEQG